MEFKLIIKKINNTLTQEEEKIFDAWHGESEQHRQYFIRAKENYFNGLEVVDIKKGWDGVSSKIDKRKNPYVFIKYVAAAVILIAAGTFWLSLNEKTEIRVPNNSSPVVEKVIGIGKDKATLTLEDGSKITLEKGGHYETDRATSNGVELVYDGNSVIKKKNIAQNILTIPRGGQFSVVLADGTKVWVNSESQLKYPVAFTENKNREVLLVYGEAYFDVSPSEDHNGTHFIVHNGNQHVDVLGTEFNIKAYLEDEFISTTLVEGKVLVKSGDTSESLTPGLQSKLTRNTQEFEIDSVDIYNEISWKNGFFSFKEQSLEEIMRVLSRWYDVDVVFENEDKKKLRFNGIFRKNQHIDEILQIIRNTNEVDFTINEKTIIME